jgi:hypothetical protein
VLDGTTCPINRPNSLLQRWFYSGKDHRHCIKYEVGVDVENGRLVWVGGPVPGSVHDMKLAKLFGLLDNLMDDEYILADKGYIGEWNIITPVKNPQTLLEYILSHLISSLRWIVENVLARIKGFRCLSTKWRHSIDLHFIVFYVVCEIVNVDMINRPVRR